MIFQFIGNPKVPMSHIKIGDTSTSMFFARFSGSLCMRCSAGRAPLLRPRLELAAMFQMVNIDPLISPTCCPFEIWPFHRCNRCRIQLPWRWKPPKWRQAPPRPGPQEFTEKFHEFVMARSKKNVMRRRSGHWHWHLCSCWFIYRFQLLDITATMGQWLVVFSWCFWAGCNQAEMWQFELQEKRKLEEWCRDWVARSRAGAPFCCCYCCKLRKVFEKIC